MPPDQDAAAPDAKVFADLSGWRKVGVSGDGVLSWLESVCAVDLSGMAPNRACHAVAVSSAGDQATFTVSAAGGSLYLLQQPAQPPVDILLAAEAAAADITLTDRSTELALFAFPGRELPPDAAGTAISAPSCLGTGVDLLCLAEDHDRLLRSFQRRFTQAEDAAALPPR
jgi:hypothetical protein